VFPVPFFFDRKSIPLCGSYNNPSIFNAFIDRHTHAQRGFPESFGIYDNSKHHVELQLNIIGKVKDFLLNGIVYF